MTEAPPRLAYLAASGLCALLHNVIVIGLDALGFHYVQSSLVSFAACVVVGFALHSALTFTGPQTAHAFWRYTVGMAANLPMSIAALFILVDVAGLPIAVATPLSMGAIVLANYWLVQWAILGRRTAR